MDEAKMTNCLFIFMLALLIVTFIWTVKFLEVPQGVDAQNKVVSAFCA